LEVHVLQLIVTPDCTEPLIAHEPAQDCRQPQVIAAVPQLFSTQLMSNAPPPSIMHTCPGAHVIDWQKTFVQGPVSTLQAPPLQLATVRPAAAQSS
jgi:hypothetical protein